MNKLNIEINEYTHKLAHFIGYTDIESIATAIKELRECVKNGNRIFVFGNGGSAATANHLAADFEKNAVKSLNKKPKIISLSTDCSKILAYGNDVSFEEVFSRQLSSLGSEHDIAIAISASGNSPNVIHAIGQAGIMKMKTIGLSGFNGGMLKEISDISIHCPMESYELVEDLHSMVCHIFVSCFDISE